MAAGFFALDRGALSDLRSRLDTRIPGACMSIMRYLLAAAAWESETQDGVCVERGECSMSRKEIARETGLSIQTIRSAEQVLRANQHGSNTEVTTHLTHQVTPGRVVYVVVNYDSYDATFTATNNASGNPSPANQHASNNPTRARIRKDLEDSNTEELPSGELDSPPAPTNGVTSKRKLERLCTKYPEVPLILKDNWLAHHPLPASSQTPSAKLRIADTIRLLHTADEYPWPVIASIVEYAAKEWAPKGMIGSPASLREWTKKHDRKTHEAIVEQMNSTDTADDELSTLRKDILG